MTTVPGAKGIPFGTKGAHPDGSVDTSGVEGLDSDLLVRPFGWKGTFTTPREFITGSLHVHVGIQSDEFLRVPFSSRHPTSTTRTCRCGSTFSAPPWR